MKRSHFSVLVATNTAVNCNKISLNKSNGVTLTNVEKKSPTVVTIIPSTTRCDSQVKKRNANMMCVIILYKWLGCYQDQPGGCMAGEKHSPPNMLFLGLLIIYLNKELSQLNKEAMSYQLWFGKLVSLVACGTISPHSLFQRHSKRVLRLRLDTFHSFLHFRLTKYVSQRSALLTLVSGSNFVLKVLLFWVECSSFARIHFFTTFCPTVTHICTTHMFTRVLTFVSKPLRTSALKSGLVSCHAIAAQAEPLL